ncbi:hypothetical protein MK079_04510 [Candidatus Gracilibacteria bacterium]|nr:hypothetical protein [Candidatus Gracilibacteria bacterium]
METISINQIPESQDNILEIDLHFDKLKGNIEKNIFHTETELLFSKMDDNEIKKSKIYWDILNKYIPENEVA